MKTNEFVSKKRNLGESQALKESGLRNWLLRHGLAGRAKALIATTKHQEYLSREIGFAQWAARLRQMWDGAVNSGQVSLSESLKSFRNYDDFDSLLEEMINEQNPRRTQRRQPISPLQRSREREAQLAAKKAAQPAQAQTQAPTQPIASSTQTQTQSVGINPASWIKNYAKKYTKDHQLPSNYDAVMNQLATQFEKEIKAKPSMDFENPSAAPRKIYDFLYGVSLSQTRDPQGRIIRQSEAEKEYDVRQQPDANAFAQDLIKRFDQFSQSNGKVSDPAIKQAIQAIWAKTGETPVKENKKI